MEVDGVGQLLALDVTVAEESGKTRLTFFVTNRGRVFYGDITEKSPAGFTFVSEHNQLKTFRLATVSEFDREWRNGRVEGNVPDFKTDDELYAWYRKLFLDK